MESRLRAAVARESQRDRVRLVREAVLQVMGGADPRQAGAHDQHVKMFRGHCFGSYCFRGRFFQDH